MNYRAAENDKELNDNSILKFIRINFIDGELVGFKNSDKMSGGRFENLCCCCSLKSGGYVLMVYNIIAGFSGCIQSDAFMEPESNGKKI